MLFVTVKASELYSFDIYIKLYRIDIYIEYIYNIAFVNSER